MKPVHRIHHRWSRETSRAPSAILCALLLSIGCSPSSAAPTTTGGGGSPAGVGGAAGSAGVMMGVGGSVDGAGGSVGGSAGVAGTGLGGAGASGVGATGGSAAVGGSGGSGGLAPDLSGDIVFSVPSQAFQGQLNVGMTSQFTDGEIRYTTDGTLPNASSTLYAGAELALTETTQLRAQVFVAGAPAGNPGTALYVARSIDATSDLPLVLIDGYGAGKPEDKDVFVDAAFMLFEPEGGTSMLSHLPNVATRAGWHLRGQSSASFEKAPYRVELWDNASEDLDVALLGMPEEADWAMIGPYVDRTLIRNAFVYTLGREMGLVAPRFAYVEAYINYEDRALTDEDYEGVYMVVETIKNAKNRIDLNQLREEDTMLPDISGGYIFKFDQAAVEGLELTCTSDDPFGSGFGGPSGGTCFSDVELVDPDPANSEQVAYVTGFLEEFNTLLHTDPIGDYASYIDLASFVDHFVIAELTRDIDAYIRSCYYHKDQDGLLKAGPLWDYNLAMGTGVAQNRELEGWQWEEGRQATNDWHHQLFAEAPFRALITTRWAELRQGLLSDAQIQARIQSVSAPLTAAAVRDHARWPVSDIDARFQLPNGDTWQAQMQALEQWLLSRVAWLDSQLT